MTDDLSSPKFLELLTLLLIVFHGSNVAATRAEAAPSSPLPSQMDAKVRIALPASASDDGALSSLVEAPVEVVGPRAVESTMLEKVEMKRESGVEKGARDKISFGVINGHEQSVRVEDDSDDDWGEDEDEAGNSIEDDEDADDEELEEKEEEEEQEGEGNSDDDEDANDEDDVILEQKVGRHYREGPRIWDQWGKWSSCSVSCGAGKLTRWRHCVAGGCSLGNYRKRKPKVWDQWGRWSSCSATCGIGKYTRWRHCVAGGCVSGEKEAQIKFCKMNRCS